MKISIFWFGLWLTACGAHSELSATKVFLNNEQMDVFFNDGDTFRILNGSLKGVRARVSGINSLESYGAVHQWGEWQFRELYKVAKEATYLARTGPWHCVSDLDQDGYGRILVKCSDLNEMLLSRGLAHTMFMTEQEINEDSNNWQKTAIENHLGMWAKGIPSHIVTSLHSIEEMKGSTPAYDRFVSSKTGLSIIRKHRQSYVDCGIVCGPPDGLSQDEPTTPSCMLYVNIANRFGPQRASCLE